MLNSIAMLKIKFSIAFICTLLLLAAGIQGMFIESALLRPAQILSIVLLIVSITLYLKLLSLQQNATNKT